MQIEEIVTFNSDTKQSQTLYKVGDRVFSTLQDAQTFIERGIV